MPSHLDGNHSSEPSARASNLLDFNTWGGGEKYRQHLCPKGVQQFPVGGDDIRAFTTQYTVRIGKTIDHVYYDDGRFFAEAYIMTFKIHE